MKIDKDEFERLVHEAFERLPEHFKEKLENVEIAIEDMPGPALSQKKNLLGLYHGVPKTRRGIWYANVLPDKITIFKRTLERQASTETELGLLIEKVVRHEIGHHFGLSESKLRAVE